MKSVKEITEKYYEEYGDNFGIEITRDKMFPKRVEIKSFWGIIGIYEKICSDLRKAGYTVFG
jgi:hypothetical protein